MGPAELLVVGLAVLLGASVKAVTGLGLPIVAIPAMSLFISVEEAVAIVAVPNAVMNAVMVPAVDHARSQTRDLPALALFGAVGAVAGTVILVSVPEEPLLLLLAAMVLGYVLTAGWRQGVAVSPATSKRWAPVVGLGAGLMQGSVGISGPVVATWIHAYRLPRDAYVYAVTVIFLLAGIAQLVVLAVSGRLWGTPLVLGLLASVPVVATVPLGTWIRARLAGPVFDRAVLAMLSVGALALVGQVVF